MSSTATLQAPVGHVDELILTARPTPTRQGLIERAVRETGCSVKQAESWYKELSAAARATSGIHHVRQLALNTMHDAVLTKVMPDDAVAQPGTLHADVNEHFSAEVGRPVALTHVNRDKGTVRDCAITVRNTAKTGS